MGPGPRLQTEVTHTYGDKYPVRISVEAGMTKYAFDITEKDATNLANRAKKFNCDPDIRFSPIQGMDFIAYWLASDRFEIKGEDRSTGVAILFRLNQKQAWTLYDQIMFTRSQVSVMKQNGVQNPVSTLGQQPYAAINGSSMNLTNEFVEVKYIKDAKYPIYFKIVLDGQMIQEEITIVAAQGVVKLLEDSKQLNINVCFVSEKNWEYAICWLKNGQLRLAFRDQGFNSQMEITHKTAHDLYEKIKDILCGPASNMKSTKTEECPDCKGKGYIEMLNRNVDCDCVGRISG